MLREAPACSGDGRAWRLGALDSGVQVRSAGDFCHLVLWLGKPLCTRNTSRDVILLP